MSTPNELQDEEREVLLSIYDGDAAFKQLSPTVFQYMYGEHDTNKSFLMELQWSENYPNEKPIINMNTFYNRNLLQSIKNKITSLVTAECDQFLGEAMTYSIFECVKERFDDFIAEQPEEIVENMEKMSVDEEKPVEERKVHVKKEQLTKAQKRRQWDRVEAKGEKPRGWDWVDIVKHLSQTGTKDEPGSAT